jgi:sec-independent protein translocase protein TatA
MNFGNLGFTEILILVMILVLFFGAKRIPEIGASIGQGIKEFKRSLSAKDADEQRDVPPGSSGSSALPPPSGADPKRLSQ